LTSGIFYVLVSFMNEAACPIAAEPHASGCPCGDERVERQLRTLQELAEIGMDLAREVRVQALAPALAEPASADFGLMFSRIARAVRQTLALEAKLAEDRTKARTEAAQRRLAQARAHGGRRKLRIEHIVERAIEAESDGRAREDLLGDLYERLLDHEEVADFAERPIAEWVTRICRDLGVTPDPSLWENEDWANGDGAVADPGPPHSGEAPPSVSSRNRPSPCPGSIDTILSG
jgi:hypothetical protein